MDDNLRKTVEDQNEFKEFFEAVFPYLTMNEKQLPIELTTAWANAAIARRGAA